MPKASSAVRRFGRVTLAALTLILVSSCNIEKPRKLPPDFLEKTVKLYSQYDEENIIRHFFDDMKGGFFVDVGCSHYKKNSTTYFLEEQRGWSGIGIDALAGFGPEYVEYRPRTKFFNYIVTDHAGTKDKFYKLGWVSSTNLDHVNSFPPPPGMKPEEIEVATITLDKLLDEHGVESIDLLSLDIELGEPAALRGFDIDRFKPRLVVVEAGNQGVRDFLQPYFTEHGYERIEEYRKYDKVNWYYKPRVGP